LTLIGALIHVCVPPADVGERHFEPHVGFGQLRDLTERLAERTAGIVRVVGRLIPGRVRAFEHLDGVERFLARAVQ
jgi:hypothetical protein